MKTTFKRGIGQVRTRPVLILILAVAVFHGMSTEGFDRLYALHLIRHTTFPPLGELDPVVWFGIINGVALLLAIGAAEIIKRRVDVSTNRGAAGTLLVLDVLLVVAVVVFGLTSSFAVAVGAIWVVGVARAMQSPVYTAWINQGLDPASRATVNSLGGQMDAFGQMAAGPGLGFIATVRSVQTAIVVSGLLRVPSLVLFGRALSGDRDAPVVIHDADAAEFPLTGIPGPPGPDPEFRKSE